MNASSKSVFWDIINCGIHHFSAPGPCSSVIHSQGGSITDFHVPEPWNGNIDSARILFVSINPGYSPDELFPRTGNPYWMSGSEFNTSKVEEYFEHRFDLNYLKYPMCPYVDYKKGGHAFKIRMENRPPKSVRGFWTYVFKMANTLIPGADPVKDFAITELVHCKSRDTNFITDACIDQCMMKHFAKVLAQAKNVEYVVFIGRSVREKVCSHYGFPKDIVKQKWHITTKLNSRCIKIIFVDHNNARSNKKSGRKRCCGIPPVPINIPLPII